MTMYDRLQASIACVEAPYKAPISKRLSGVPYRPLGVVPENLRGLWCLIHTMRIEVEAIRHSIRCRELGYGLDEVVRDDHDYTEAGVKQELRSDPNHGELMWWLDMAIQIFTHALKEVFPGEEDMKMAVRFNWLNVDQLWSLSTPNPIET